MRSVPLFILLILLAPEIFGSEWEMTKNIDPMTDEISCFLHSAEHETTEGNKVLIVIAYSVNYHSLAIISTFGSKHEGTIFEKEVKLDDVGYFRIDSNQAIKSEYPVSRENATSHIIVSKIEYLITQMKAGNTLKVSNGREVAEMSLIGFTKSYNQYQECELFKKMESQ